MRVLLLAAFAALAFGSAAAAAPCRDPTTHKFVKCPAKPKVCRDSKGHYMKCK